jgi:uncharacterized protein
MKSRVNPNVDTIPPLLYTTIMSRSEILQILSCYKAQNQYRYGIIAMGLFGSIARNAGDDSSDVDIVVELEKADLFIMADIKQDIEQTVGRPVDIVRLRTRMNPLLKKRIESEAVYV